MVCCSPKDEAHGGRYLGQGVERGRLDRGLGQDRPGRAAPTRSKASTTSSFSTIGLPGWTDGVCCGALRTQRTNPCAVCLTACDRVEDRVRGLDLGRTTIWSSRFAFSEFSRG